MSDGSKVVLPQVIVGGIRVVRLSRAELAEQMVVDCRARRDGATAAPRLVFDCNGQGLSLSASNAAFKRALDAAEIIHADGQFIVWMSQLVGEPIAERSATTDMIHDCARRATKEGLSFYLLGGTEVVNAEVARRLQALYPGLAIVGRRNGYFSPDEEASVVEDINRARPDVLWVGIGKPKEQLFCAHWGKQMSAGWVVTCGGCYNYITGDYSRAPLIVQRLGMEWIYRAFTDPRKLLWRYMTTTPHALWLAGTRSRAVRPEK